VTVLTRMVATAATVATPPVRITLARRTVMATGRARGGGTTAAGVRTTAEWARGTRVTTRTQKAWSRPWWGS